MSNNQKENEKEIECGNIFTFLMGKYYHYLEACKDDVNEYMKEKRGDNIKDDVRDVIGICWDMLMSVANNDKKESYVSLDIISICVNMFKPFFKNDQWIKDVEKQNRDAASIMRLHYNIFEASDGLYCSTIKYLDQLIADSCA